MICIGSGNGSEILTVEVALKNKRETEGERERAACLLVFVFWEPIVGLEDFFFFSPTTLAYTQQLLGTVCLDACKTLHAYTMCCHFLTLVPHSSFLAFFKIYVFPWGSTLLSVGTVSTALWWKPAWCPSHLASLEPGGTESHRGLCGSLKQQAKVETSASWPQVCGMREQEVRSCLVLMCAQLKE